jgi:hypothetical protein
MITYAEALHKRAAAGGFGLPVNRFQQEAQAVADTVKPIQTVPDTGPVKPQPVQGWTGKAPRQPLAKSNFPRNTNVATSWATYDPGRFSPGQQKDIQNAWSRMGMTGPITRVRMGANGMMTGINGIGLSYPVAFRPNVIGMTRGQARQVLGNWAKGEAQRRADWVHQQTLARQPKYTPAQIRDARIRERTDILRQQRLAADQRWNSFVAEQRRQNRNSMSARRFYNNPGTQKWLAQRNARMANASRLPDAKYFNYTPQKVGTSSRASQVLRRA